MAWSEAARQAALEARRAKAKAKGVALDSKGKLRASRGEVAAALRDARKSPLFSHGPVKGRAKAVRGSALANLYNKKKYGY